MIELRNVKNIEALFKCIDSCEEKVELVAPNMVVNLKSRLAQYLSAVRVFATGNIDSVYLKTYCASDAQRLVDFMVNGEGL